MGTKGQGCVDIKTILPNINLDVVIIVLIFLSFHYPYNFLIYPSRAFIFDGSFTFLMWLNFRVPIKNRFYHRF